jgi:membrane-associated phospholipid phosphatase
MPVMDLKNNFSIAIWTWTLPVFAFMALTIVLATGTNIALFQWLNMALSGQTWWTYITVFGDTTLALAFILLLIGRRPDLAWQIFLAAILATILTHAGKELFSSLRPPSVLPIGSFHLIGPTLEHNSFPSGHTTTAFVLAGLVCLQPTPPWLKASVLLMAVLVGLSRIACGVHWPIDVAGGMFGGWLSAVFGIALAQRWPVGLRLGFQRVLVILMTGIAVWSMFFYDNGFSNTWLLQFLVTAVCLGLSLKWQYRLFKFK